MNLKAQMETVEVTSIASASTLQVFGVCWRGLSKLDYATLDESLARGV